MEVPNARSCRFRLRAGGAAMVGDQSLKTEATGKGNAKKPEMQAAAKAR